MDGLPAELFGALGPTALLGLAVLFLLTGRLIPRSTHMDRVADKDARIAYLESALDKRDAQVSELLTQGKLTVELLRSIEAKAGPR